MPEDNPRNKSKRTESRSGKPQKTYKQPVEQRRKRTAGNKALVMFTAIGAVAAVIYAGTTIVQTLISERHRREDKRARIVSVRPPEMLQTFTCDTIKGFHVGNMRLSYRNVGNDVANVASPGMWFSKVIPERKTGEPVFDEIPEVECQIQYKVSDTSPVAPGTGISLEMRQMAMTLPPISNGESVQVYAVSCISYSDSSGWHTTCDRYRLNVASDNPLDQINGTPVFPCDGQTWTGTFVGDISGHCAN